MSHPRRLVAAMAALATLLAIPAGASAKPTAKLSAQAQVQLSVDRADTAVKRMKRYARLGSERAVARQLRIARSHTAAASRTARRMAHRAVSEDQNAVAAQALTLAGTQYDELLEAITAIVDQVTGTVQGTVAGAIAPSLAGKDRIVELLNGLLDEVPTELQPVLASIVTALSVGDATEVVNLDDALDSGSLPSSISGIVSDCLAIATSMIDDAFGMLKSLVPMLPEAAQAPLTQVLDTVTGTVGTIMPTILQSVTGLIDTIIGSMPFVGTSATGGMLDFDGLLGGIVGGTPQIPGDLSGLLGGLFGGSGATAPATGGIMSTISGLIDSLLGGFLGGLAPAT